jgi:hypothetical protein
VTDLYRDQRITCTEEAIVIQWYYLWGPKTIRYSEIRSASRVSLTAARGKPRIWGTANPQYWASLDPSRPRKELALILDLGGRVKPFITPDDVPRVEEIIKQRAGLADIPFTGPAPII